MKTDQITAHKAWYAAKFSEDLEFARTGISPGFVATLHEAKRNVAATRALLAKGIMELLAAKRFDGWKDVNLGVWPIVGYRATPCSSTARRSAC